MTKKVMILNELPPCPCCGISNDEPTDGYGASHIIHDAKCVMYSIMDSYFGVDEWAVFAPILVAGLRAVGQPVHINYFKWESDHAAR